MDVTVIDEAWVWLIDGIEVAFVSREELDDAWAQEQGFERATPALVLPTSLPVGVNIRSGYLEDVSANIELEDVDGTLAEVFGGSLAEADFLPFAISPSTDPAPAGVFGKHVGLERFGPSGERTAVQLRPRLQHRDGPRFGQRGVWSRAHRVACLRQARADGGAPLRAVPDRQDVRRVARRLAGQQSLVGHDPRFRRAGAQAVELPLSGAPELAGRDDRAARCSRARSGCGRTYRPSDPTSG